MKVVQLKSSFWSAMFLFTSLSCIAQLPGVLPPTTAAPPTQPALPADPFHRDTPRGTVVNFLKYASRGDYATAAKYLQLSPKSKTDPQELAQQLLTLMDTSLRASISRVSDLPEGSLDDAPDPNTEIVGQLIIQDQEDTLSLTRVPQKGTAPIWLISKDTLDQVPGLFELAGAPAIDQYLPDSLIKHHFLGIPVGRWLAILLSMPVSLLIAFSMVRFTGLILTYRGANRDRAHLHYWLAIKKPAALAMATVLHGICVYLIGLPLLYRMYYLRTLLVLLTISVAWFIGATVDANKQRILSRSREKREAISLVQLLHGMVKALLISITLLVVLGLLGFDTKTIVAGLGIGGVALALGAQKTLENLLGGITLVADDVFAIGDTCVINGRVVTVQEIGLRSLTVRALEGPQMSFPNGMLSQVGIENLTRRNKFLVSTTLAISYETTLTQLRCVIARVREMLYSHSRIEQESARFRLTSLTSVGYEVELFAFIQSRDAAEVAAIREDVFFRIADIAESEGVFWAIPSRLTFFTKKQPADSSREADAEHVVQTWQKDGENDPFPDLSPQRRAELRGTIVYPPSSVAEQRERKQAKTQKQQAS